MTEKTRFHELRERFPETPESIVIKADAILEGIKFTPAMSRITEWAMGIPFMKEEGGSSSLAFHPPVFILNDDTTVLTVPKTESPYEFTEADGVYLLSRDGVPLTQARFMERPRYFAKATKDGSPMYTFFIQRSDSCLLIAPMNYCEYFHRGEDCKFCGFNPLWERIKKFGFSQVPRVENIVEAVLAAQEEYPLDHLKLNGGAMYDTKKEAMLYAKVAGALSKATGVEEISCIMQAVDKEDCTRLRDAGVRSVCFDLETWGEDIWPEVVPGKARAIGFQNWCRRLCDAVEVFGEGHVSTSLVGGVEMVPEAGPKGKDQGVSHMLAGFDWLIRHGIEPSFTVWTCSDGAKYCDESIIPGTEYYLELGWGLHELLKKHGMYAKLGHESLGTPPAWRRLICYKCCFANLSPDYPRLVKAPPSAPPFSKGTSSIPPFSKGG